MSESVSSIVGIFLVIILLILMPLYNVFERQDDTVYNLALKETTSFVDDIASKGYITKKMYENYTSRLARSGLGFDIEIEAHRKQYIDKKQNNQFVGADIGYEIDYKQHIVYDCLDKGEIYNLNKDDYVYIKLKNSGTTQATLMFNLISNSNKKVKIAINYGSIIKNQEWFDENGYIYLPRYD